MELNVNQNQVIKILSQRIADLEVERAALLAALSAAPTEESPQFEEQ